MSVRWRWLVAGVLLCAAVGWAAVAYAAASRTTTLEGLRVDGVRLDPTEDPHAALRALADAWLDRELGVRAGPVVVVRTRRQLGARVDVAPLADELARLGRSGDTIADVGTWWDARRGRIERHLVFEVDPAPARELAQNLQDVTDREPIAARVAHDGRLLEEARPGRSLDLASSVDAIVTAVREEEVLVELVVREERAPAPAAPPSHFGEVLGTWSTRFGRGGSRAHNVRLAAERLDGAVLAPGGTLSFNDRVGARTRGLGFRVAPVIVDGEMVDGIGGGTCQVASTLHAASFVGGLQILEHRPHSRPAGYVPLGLDATVVWPNVDLVVRNPFGVPVLVRATHQGRTLRVDLLAATRGPDVQWERVVARDAEPGERVIEDASVPMGQAQVTQDGIPGYRVVRSRVIDDGMAPRRETTTLRYPATDRIVRIPPIPTKE